MTAAPTAIDLSRIPAPPAIETLSFESMLSDFLARFIAAWDAERVRDPTLPAYTVSDLETDSVVIVGEAFSYLRFLDRARVNDAIKAVLAPLARGPALDNVVARANVARLVVKPATDTAPAVMESDVALLRRYLMSFDRASAGSRDRYLYEAWTAWPGMGDARVNGRAVHGRLGDTDIVIAGPDGRDATTEERAIIRAAVTDDRVRPEAVAVRVVNATRALYSVSLSIETAPGPDPEIVRAEAEARVKAAADSRLLIGAEIPPGYLEGAAYGANVIRVYDLAPVSIDPEPYQIPVAVSISVAVTVRQ